MPRRDRRHGDSGADIHPLAPVVGFGGNRRIMTAHDGVIAERRDHARPMCGGKPRQRGKIEMIVMAVRHQHDVDRRQVDKGDARIVHSFGTDETERRSALRPNRIEQDIQASRLNEEAGMTDIGNAPGLAFDPRRRTIGTGRWRPGRPLRLGPAPMPIDKPAQQIRPAFRRRGMRVEKALAVEVIGDRAIVIARHSDPNIVLG